jgi:hypothetical protein
MTTMKKSENEQELQQQPLDENELDQVAGGWIEYPEPIEITNPDLIPGGNGGKTSSIPY